MAHVRPHVQVLDENNCLFHKRYRLCDREEPTLAPCAPTVAQAAMAVLHSREFHLESQVRLRMVDLVELADVLIVPLFLTQQFHDIDHPLKRLQVVKIPILDLSTTFTTCSPPS